MKTRLTIFKPKGGHEQDQFWDRLEDLLDALHKDKIPPERVHSVVNNTRTWMALVIVGAT